MRKSSPVAIAVDVVSTVSRAVKESDGVMGTKPRTISDSGLACFRGLVLNGWLVRLCIGLQCVVVVGGGTHFDASHELSV